MTQRQRRRQRRRAGVGMVMLFVVAGLAAVAIAAALIAGGKVISIAEDAPPLGACRAAEQGGTSILYAADGSRLGYVRSDQARIPVPIGRIARPLRRATVAIEDQRFYRHRGIDYEGGLRALIEDITAGQIKQGGSTITMQLMRNICFRSRERTVERKIQEAKLALDYEKRHSKAQILDQYLNSASYGTVDGRTAVGAEAAARTYFSRPAARLDLAQSALLAGLPQAPSEYNPLLDPGAARERRNEVLGRMADLGYVSRDAAGAAQARGLELDLSDSFSERREPFFFDYVERLLIDRYGFREVRNGGLRVRTTIVPRYQRVGREAISSVLPYSTDPASALVAIDPRNGRVRAMASSADYGSSQFDLATQGHRQPGSTFKMFVLTTAIRQGIDPYRTYYTSKPLSLDLARWGHWDVHTADEGYLGTVNVQQATVASDNTVFAQLDLDVGPGNVARTARRMGVTTKLDGIPAEGLGGLRIGVSPLEMADAFATLASGGVHRNPVSIESVRFPDGRVEHPQLPDPRRVLPQNVAYEVTRILHDNITGGTGTAAYTGCVGQAGKTGTTDNYVDAWFDGYQPNLATAVWVGYPQSNEVEMTSVHGITVFGGTFPADIWNAFYSGAQIPCDYFEVPAQPVAWAPYFGSFTASAPRQKPEPGTGAPAAGGGGGGGYDPSLYAPGAGTQQPVVPPSPPAAGGGVGGAQQTGAGGGT
ncbi:MAG: transglycosylase domain-containing protein [Solirubrobacterales bacterium]